MFDAIVIGGSYAGLSAAMYIARACRRVAVVDTGLPRNRYAAHSHGFFSRDGSVPRDVIATAREQVAAYPTVAWFDRAAVDAQRGNDGYTVTLGNGETIDAARLVLAYGVADTLPDVPGVAERWGRSVLHCPYCHGFEAAGRRLGVLAVSPLSAHQAMLVAEWGPTTYYLNGLDAPDDDVRAELARRGVAIEPARVVALHGDGTNLDALAFDDGRRAAVDALFVGTRTRPNGELAQRLGCALDDVPFGTIVRTDDNRETTVRGVFAAGDIVRGAHSATFASADGVTAGVGVHRSLVF
ncbi:MAG TPA: NAD(P)/FAD-dependent oxidoreductase [Tahibacter sp.]|nr:NAD(P)/FAD-dependent oxidoreductase [Tahibacter sp.]